MRPPRAAANVETILLASREGELVGSYGGRGYVVRIVADLLLYIDRHDCVRSTQPRSRELLALMCGRARTLSWRKFASDAALCCEFCLIIHVSQVLFIGTRHHSVIALKTQLYPGVDVLITWTEFDMLFA